MRLQTGVMLALLVVPATAFGQVPAPSVPSDTIRCGGAALPAPAPTTDGAALDGEIRRSIPPVPIPNACEDTTGTQELRDLSSRIMIRSMGDPLYVIDGVSGSSASFNSLSSEDIESISILRNEDAISEFGSQGRNGVVIVRTRAAPDLPDEAPEP